MSAADDLICSECGDDQAVEGYRLCLDCLEEVGHEHEWRPRPGETVVDEVLGVQVEECECGEERHRTLGPCLCAIHRQDYELEASWWLQEADVVLNGRSLLSLRPRLLLHPVTLAKLRAPEDPSAWLEVALARLVREAHYQLDLVEDRIGQDMARRRRRRAGLRAIIAELDVIEERAITRGRIVADQIMSGAITTTPILTRLDEGRERG